VGARFDVAISEPLGAQIRTIPRFFVLVLSVSGTRTRRYRFEYASSTSTISLSTSTRESENAPLQKAHAGNLRFEHSNFPDPSRVEKSASKCDQ
jgi:hypothetical protein